LADTDEKLTDWNLRGFPVDLKTECQKMALDEQSATGKRLRDADIVARLLRRALVLDSENEDRQRTIRRTSPANDQQGTTKNRRNKGP